MNMVWVYYQEVEEGGAVINIYSSLEKALKRNRCDWVISIDGIYEALYEHGRIMIYACYVN